MEPGLYITFFSSDEPADRELPAVGPLYNLVMRHKTLVAERRSVMQAQELGVAIDRWLEAELEMQRATGEEPGGTKRSERRVSARDGVFIRFAVFGENNESDIAPELGPFASVVVSPRSVEADGTMIATRAASDLAPWELTRGAGDALDGSHKPDLAFRTSNTSYHPSITPEAPRLRLEPAAAAAPVPVVPAPTPVVPEPAPAASRPIPTEPAFALPPRVDDVFTPPSVPEPFFTPPPRTEEVFRSTPRTEQVFTSTPRSEQVFTTAPRSRQIVDAASPEPEAAKSPPQRTETLFVERPKKQTEIYTARGVPSAPPKGPSLTPADKELIARIDRQRSDETLRARIHEGERQRLGLDERAVAERAAEDESSVALRYRARAETTEVDETDGAALEWGPAMWRMRFAIIGVLLLLVGAYAFIFLRTGGAPTLAGTQPQGTRVVPVGQRFAAPGWEFQADGVTRVDAAGSSHARGIYVVVRLLAINKAIGTSQLALASFALVDTKGARYAPEGISTATYQGGPSAGATYGWGDDLASARTLAITLVFDIDPTLTRGMLLELADTPGVRVRLD